MVMIIKEGASLETIRKHLNKIKSKKTLKTSQYKGGVIKLKESPLEIQKKMRDEWE